MSTVIKEVESLRHEVSCLAKNLNRVNSLCTKQVSSCKNRKLQIKLWNAFFNKLLKEGRISKKELSEYSPRKTKASIN